MRFETPFLATSKIRLAFNYFSRTFISVRMSGMLMKWVALPALMAFSIQAGVLDSAAKSDTLAPQTVAETKPATVEKEKPTDFRIFNDQSLAMREYGFGILGGVVAGTLGFYIGSGLESAIQGKDAKNGTLEFKGIRYDNFHGAFYGGCGALWLGSSLTSYFVGEIDEEDGGALWTLFGGAASTAAAMALATALDVNDHRNWQSFIPLVVLPATGSTLAFNVSRYFRDKRRATLTQNTRGWQPPTVQLGWLDNTSAVQVNAFRWTFQ
jgi:hypothetical protein